MKILVTGALGYISVHFINELFKTQKDIVLMDNLSNSSIDNLKCINPSLPFYEMDICNEDGIRSIFKEHQIELVVHFAGLKSVPESNKKSLLYYENNVSGTITLLKIMKEFNCKKIIFSSTACVYKESNMSHGEEEDILLSDISNSYGKTKFVVEQILKDATVSYGFECVVLRYFNPVGILIPNLYLPKNISNLMDVIIDSIVHSKTFHIFGCDYPTKDGTCVRDFIHIYDLVCGHVKAIDYISKVDKTPFEIFNLGCGNGISVLELILTFERVNQLSLSYVYGPRRENDVAISFATIDKAINILNWKPTKNIEDMCIDSYRYINQ
jgi:UDP-glucose 4-epimerase